MTYAQDLIDDICLRLKGTPVFLTGSLVAEAEYNLTMAHDDVDLFVPSEPLMFITVQKLLAQQFTLDERAVRVWARWQRQGFRNWHTNSIRLHSPTGDIINVVYKKYGGQPTSSLSQVLESFDFGLLGVGYEIETGTRRDLRPYLFPGWDVDGPLPLMPDKRDNWRQGFISQYNGLREVGRYAKYHTYGHQMEEIKEDLMLGYRMTAEYHKGHFDDEKKLFGEIYEKIADLIMLDDVAEMTRASKEINYTDSLDAIMEALE